MSQDSAVAHIILWALLLASIVAFILMPNHINAHDLHLSDIQEQLGPMVTNFIPIDGFGYIGATEGYNGGPNQWWLFYKDIDLVHQGVHAKRITQQQAMDLIDAQNKEMNK
jgi:hypothetical protein